VGIFFTGIESNIYARYKKDESFVNDAFYRFINTVVKSTSDVSANDTNISEAHLLASLQQAIFFA
jgi:hypothetical protein